MPHFLKRPQNQDRNVIIMVFLLQILFLSISHVCSTAASTHYSYRCRQIHVPCVEREKNSRFSRLSKNAPDKQKSGFVLHDFILVVFLAAIALSWSININKLELVCRSLFVCWLVCLARPWLRWPNPYQRYLGSACCRRNGFGKFHSLKSASHITTNRIKPNEITSCSFGTLVQRWQSQCRVAELVL